MKKILITTFNKAYNYGAQLQEYALQKTINNSNVNCEVLNYSDPEINKHYTLFGIGTGNIKTKIIRIIKNFVFLNKNIKRKKNFQCFEKKYIKYTYKKYTEKTIKKEKIQKDIYITGSDQVWNPEITGGLSDVYTLNFGNDNIKRISYAASIGNEKNVQKYKKEYQKKLSGLDKISVREESAKKELEKIFPEKNIEVVLDPTLLLNKEEWEVEINNIKPEKEKYILAYIVEENEEHTKIVNELSQKTNIKIISFERKKRYNQILRSAYTDGPLEFIKLIKNAEYIVATSFHATVFSIIFNKKFWIVPHKTTGSRVTDLLKKLGISNRAVNTIDEFKERDYNEEIDYERVNKKLEEERKKSIKWLMDAIEK